MESDSSDEKLLAGILLKARVEDPQAIVRLMMLAQIKASDLVAVSDERAEQMLQQAGLLIGDCVKIVRALREFHSGRLSSLVAGAAGSSSSRGGPLRLCSCCAAMRRSLAAATRIVSAPGRPNMKCGLILYSMTVLIVSITVFSFYLPAIVFQVHAAHPSEGGVIAHLVASACSYTGAHKAMASQRARTVAGSVHNG